MRKAKTSEMYLVAGRNLGIFMFFGALTAVLLGGSSVIGTAQLGYEVGLAGVWFVFSMGLGIMFFGLALCQKVTGFQLMTISELLGRLYNVQSNLMMVIVSVIQALMFTV